MTEIQTRVSVKRNEGEVVSADVNLYNDGGDIVKRVVIVDSEVLESLEATVESYEENYISNNQLETILRNQSEDIVINATTLDNKNASDFARNNHSHNEYSPIIHSSTSNEYGVGSSSKYGHVKTIDNLNTPAYISGEALSARQGAVLNSNINSTQSQVDNLQNEFEKNFTIKVGRSRDRAGENSGGLSVFTGESVYVKAYANNVSSVAGQALYIQINNVIYSKNFNNNGEYVQTISLNPGTYMMTVIAKGNGLNPAYAHKVIEVV